MTQTSAALSLDSRQNQTTASLFRRLVMALSATLVVAVAAHVSFPLPFTPVPFTLQPLAVLGVGLALGPVDGALAMLAYLAEGAAGLPVFSPTGFGGVAQLMGATGGYLFAYPVVAFLAGAISRALRSRLEPFAAALAACTVATVFLFACGASWLAHELHLNPHLVWIAGIAPFLPGEAIKVLAAAGAYRAVALRSAR